MPSRFVFRVATLTLTTSPLGLLSVPKPTEYTVLPLLLIARPFGLFRPFMGNTLNDFLANWFGKLVLSVALTHTPWLTTAQPGFGPTFDPAELAQLLNLSPADIDDERPLERVSTGLLYVLVPVKSLAAMQKIRVNVQAFEAWLLAHQEHKTNSPNRLYTSIYAFCQETYHADNQVNARMFCFEQGKVAEDPATGSAGSCLLAYLLKNKVVGTGPVRLRVEQGYEVGRPSLLESDGVVTDGGGYNLQVGGQVQYVARGEWG